MPSRIIVLLTGAIGASILSVIYPFYGLLLLVFVNFGRPADDRPNVLVLHLPAMFTTAVLLGMIFRFSETGPAVFAALKRMKPELVLIALISNSVLLHYTADAWSGLDEFLTLMLFCVITVAYLTTEKKLEIYIATLIASGSYIMKVAIQNPRHMVENVGGEQFVRVNMHSQLGGSNYLALYMVLLIFLSLSLMAFYRSLWVRVVLLGVVGAGGYVFFMANSRGASIALACGLIVMWLTSKSKVKGALLGLVLIGAFVFFAPDSYWDRLHTISNYQQDASATGRLELWSIAGDIIASNPIFGIGFNNFQHYAFNSQHEAYLQVASEVGIPGLIAYVVVLASGIYSSLRARRLSSPKNNGSRYIFAVSQGVLCCLIAVTVQGFTTGLAHREVVHVFVCLSYCLKYVAEQKALELEVAESVIEQPAIASYAT